jgi:solute carrier family 13 (sodium-dependent dicarboxylate transporter), member 2/3/5
MAQAMQVAKVGGAEQTETSARKIVGFITAVAVSVLIWFASLHFAANPKHALAVAAFMIVAWIAEPIPHALTGLIGCYLFWVLKVVKFDVAFSGFADQTPWFLFGAGLFGMMATKTGLGRRLAYLIIRRVGTSYSRLLLGIILTSFLLTFLVPSGIACVVIMASVALGLMQVFGLGPGSNVGKGIFTTLTYTAGCFDKMVIAGPSTILGRGLIEKGANVHIYYGLWLLAFLPCAVVTIFGIWRLVLSLYPPEDAVLTRGTAFLREEVGKMGPWTRMEKRALFLMLLAIALWMTDLLHHISPAIIGLGIGLFACLPRVGVLDEKDMKKVNYLLVFFVATAVSMGTVLVETGALRTMTAIMFDWMRSLIVSSSFGLALVPYWTAFVYHIFLGNEIGMLATSMPGLMSFARASGIHPLPLGLIWAFAAGGKIFVYQSGVLVVGYSYGYFTAKDVFRVGLCVTVMESLVLLLLVPFYWPLIGIS